MHIAISFLVSDHFESPEHASLQPRKPRQGSSLFWKELGLRLDKLAAAAVAEARVHASTCTAAVLCYEMQHV